MKYSLNFSNRTYNTGVPRNPVVAGNGRTKVSHSHDEDERRRRYAGTPTCTSDPV